MSKKSVIFHSSLHKYELGIIILILVNSTCTNNLVFKVFYLFLIGFLLFAAIILSFCSLTFFFVQIPFVRYVARHNCSSVKRFCIDKVFREKKVYGQHPRELTECAFDIITPNLGR